jgi:hypothetical protein
VIKVVLLKKLLGCIAELRRQDKVAKLHGQVDDINSDELTKDSPSADSLRMQLSVPKQSRESSTVGDREQPEVQSVRGPAGAELLRRLENGELTAEQETIVRAQLGLAVEDALTATTPAAAARATAINDELPDRPLQSSYLVPDD